MPLEEAAEWLGITPRHLRRLVAERRVSHFRIGGRLIFAVPDLEALLARSRREALRWEALISGEDAGMVDARRFGAFLGVWTGGATLSLSPSDTTTQVEGLSLGALGVPEPFSTMVADPPWQFANRTGKVAPEHKRLARYTTLPSAEIMKLPVAGLMAERSHCYLWVPNALLQEGLDVMKAWGFTYKSNLVWHKVRKDGGSDGRGVGFYFRNVTELVLFGTRGQLRTLAPGRRQVNHFATCKREHSRKPDELYPIIEGCSPGPYLELFARYPRDGWSAWGDEAVWEK
jgi:excisionase family DNA binding protein